MDCDSIYNKRGRILSFEEARSLYLERNPGRASFHEGHNPTSHLRQPTHSQLVHGGAVPNASTVYWANQGGTASVGPNQGSLGRGSTFVRSMSPSGATASSSSPSGLVSAVSPPLIASLHGYTQLVPQKVTSHTLPSSSPLQTDTASYIPLDSSSNDNFMTKMDQHDSNYSSYSSVNNHNSSKIPNSLKLLDFSSIFTKVSQFTKDLVDILVNLNKFFLMVLIGSIFMIVFSLSMLFCLTVIWPHSVTLNPLGIYYGNIGKGGSDERNRGNYGLTTPKLADTIASPPKHAIPLTTPSTTSTFTNNSAYSSSSLSSRDGVESGPVGGGGGGVVVDKYGHLPLIGSCFVNWTRVMFTWSYHNSLQPHSSPTEQLILSQLNSYCMLKMVLKGTKLITTQVTTLPANADKFDYYRNGLRERDGNIAFLISITPCFNIPSSVNNNRTVFPYMVTNKHLNITSNYSSMVVVMERITGKKYKCNSIYDMNELQQLNYFTKKVKKAYEDFVENCSTQCTSSI